MTWRDTKLSGWGRSRWAECRAARPERLAELRAAVAGGAAGGVLAYGLGRSYGDAPLNTGGAAILTERLDRILSFDPETGLLVAEAGLTIRAVEALFLPRGFMPPVVPGTAFVTLGGAVANDVHGKNQETAGCFGDHVAWLELLLASGDIVRASPEENADLFRATVGGIGLTGVIVAVALRLVRTDRAAVRVWRRRMPDLDNFLTALRDKRADRPWSVGWIDGLARGRALGRGILELAAPSSDAAGPAAKSGRRVPLDAPGALLSAPVVRLFNAAYYSRVPAGGTEGVEPFAAFAHPLDGLRDWNRLYGRGGFFQFQCAVPFDTGPHALRAMLELTAATGIASPLAVLKAMGRPGLGDLSFAMPGFTLAIDLPNRAGVEELLRTLERLTLEAGGRVYLAKDARLSASSFAAMYPRLGAYRAALERWDPRGRFTSDMARRLGIRGGA